MRARFALACFVVLCRVAAAQETDWAATPAHPTVGDTVWLARVVSAPAGWRARPGKLETGDQAEALGDPSVLRAPGGAGWLIRYPVAFWSPGPHDLVVPPVWRLAPDGGADSVAGGVARVDVRSIIPDSVRDPEPRAALGIIRPERQDPWVPGGAFGLAVALGVGAVAWRRRPPRKSLDRPHVPLEGEVPDSRWLGAGESKAVAARARGALRRAIHRLEPSASPALSTAECLAVVEAKIPNAPIRALREVLEQLDRVGFASVQGTDVAALAVRARALATELAP